VEQLSSLQEIFDSFDAVPTYLVTYPVVRNEKAVAILKRFLSGDKCEIGAHCHPWNTPPFEEEISVRNTMLSNLPKDLIYKKLSSLHDAIVQTFGIKPISFRSGRFAFHAHVAEALVRLGYRIDTSISPFMNWSGAQGPDYSAAYPYPYKLSPHDIFKADHNGALLEVPVTIGFLYNNFRIANSFYKFLSENPIRKLHIIGVLARLQWLNRISLSPEVSNEKDMIALARFLMKKNVPCMVMYFHSPSLKEGCNRLVGTKEAEKVFISRIRSFLGFARDSGIDSVRLSDALSLA
jgi:hypothetical protein